VESIKLQKIDIAFLSEYSCLEPTDLCYFIGEYAARQGFEHRNPSQIIENMNQIINNFKKPMDRKGLSEWFYKEQAILKIAYWLISTTSWDKLKSATWVPIPPSKEKSVPLYDDRLWRVLLKMKEHEDSLDIRELLLSKSSREAAHNPGAVRPKVQDHLVNFVIDESLKVPKPRGIILFDDIITSGAHFKAAQTIIQKEFQGVPIIGLFVARNVRVEDVI
jgi:hypothetical protein